MLIYAKGFLLSLGLIVAIGAQNAFVIRQGLKREHRFLVALISAVLDALLILLGVIGMGAVVLANPDLLFSIKIVGSIYLIGFGAFSIRSAFKNRALKVKALEGKQSSVHKIILLCLSFSLLNPHCYLDTVVMLGSVSTVFYGAEKIFFSAGAMTASFVWFFGVVYAASFLQPLFSSPKAWTVLDGLIGLMMFGIAISLLIS